MRTATTAIEVNGIVDAEHRLVVNEPLPLSGPTPVRVIVLVPATMEIAESEWLDAAARNQVFDSLSGTAEDIYSLEDGRPFHDAR